VLTKPKQIVLDKESLISTNLKNLCYLAENHFLLLSDTLFYECATTSGTDRENLLRRCKKVIESGAYYCFCSVGYVKYEANNGQPYPWFLPHLSGTEEIRSKKTRIDDLLDSTKTDQVFQSRRQVARDIFLEFSKKLKTTLDLTNPEVSKAIRELPSDTFTRLQKLIERIDFRDMHQMGLKSIPEDWIKDETKFCLSADWMS
jgi:hypothetical protein